MGHRLLRTLRPAGLAAVAALTVVSCCSDRTDPVAGPAPDCSLNLDLDVLGRTTTIVQIRGFAFVPDGVRIPAGTSVTWIYCEPPGTDLHTTTSDTGVWGSDLLDVEETFTFRFDETGSFPYHCVPHPFMQATVVVE